MRRANVIQRTRYPWSCTVRIFVLSMAVIANSVFGQAITKSEKPRRFAFSFRTSLPVSYSLSDQGVLARGPGAGVGIEGLLTNHMALGFGLSLFGATGPIGSALSIWANPYWRWGMLRRGHKA
jgi:hypothetical protein